MGDRAQVEINDGTGKTVYLYTHWTGSDLRDTVKAAMKRGRDRWDDPSYLARIIFCEMVKDDVMGLTGYGICLTPAADAQFTITVDTMNQTVNKGNGAKAVSFEKFVA